MPFGGVSPVFFAADVPLKRSFIVDTNKPMRFETARRPQLLSEIF